MNERAGGAWKKKGGGKKKRKKKVISPHRITNDPGGTLLLRQRLFIIRQRFENVSARVVPSIILNTRAEHACTRNAWTRGTAPCPGTKHWFIDAFIRGERGANKSAGAYYFRKVNRSRAWPIGGEWIPQIYFPVFFVIFFLSLSLSKSKNAGRKNDIGWSESKVIFAEASSVSNYCLKLLFTR